MLDDFSSLAGSHPVPFEGGLLTEFAYLYSGSLGLEQWCRAELNFP